MSYNKNFYCPKNEVVRKENYICYLALTKVIRNSFTKYYNCLSNMGKYNFYLKQFLKNV